MKTPIRSARFTMGMVLFLVIILLLSISSAYYLNRLSGKTNAILKENHYSVVYAQDMSESLTNINQGIINCFLTKKRPDTSFINKQFMIFNKSLELEKNNITEPGEDKIVKSIETIYTEYGDSVSRFMESTNTTDDVLPLQKRFDSLYKQLMLLSQMNEKAIEEKTDDAKVSAKKAALQMTAIGTLCFLIAYGFTFIFSSYFNERFYRLYNGIKEIDSGKYNQRLNIEGNDELHEISIVFNKMAGKINVTEQEMSLTLQKEMAKSILSRDIDELKNMLSRIRSLEEQTAALIFRFEEK
jgi:nitrogen fixation/metabolism regulation signal transduction histidine kinase